LAFLDYKTKAINFKIVYWGPGLSGKTTNLKAIYEKIRTENKGKLVSFSTETERTLFFDFFPLHLGIVKGYMIKFHLYSVPGQLYYHHSRKLILKGVDAIVFIADSQAERFYANRESLYDMFECLKEYKIDFHCLPYVLQLNKRDLPNIIPANELIAALRFKDAPVVEAIATRNEGIIDTLKYISKLVMIDVKKKLL
jgi:signal recognition particle receptor subunit beta